MDEITKIDYRIKPLHKQPSLGLEYLCLQMIEKVSDEVLSLPMYPELSDENV